MAKQLTAGYPAAVGGGDQRARWPRRSRRTPARSARFGHGYTYGGHPVACAVGVKALEIYRAASTSRAGSAALAPRFAAHLDRLAGHPLVGEARHLGLIGALELAPDKSPKGFATPGKVGARMRAGADRRAA